MGAKSTKNAGADFPVGENVRRTKGARSGEDAFPPHPLKRPSRAKKIGLLILAALPVFVSLYYYDFVPPPFRGTLSSPGRLKLLAGKGKGCSQFLGSRKGAIRTRLEQLKIGFFCVAGLKIHKVFFRPSALKNLNFELFQVRRIFYKLFFCRYKAKTKHILAYMQGF